jgi:energy-coupling factor transporter ATP-binding protein EcfA2
VIVELTNIQSIKSATYHLEEKGITQIIGENSNGKSILIKACIFITDTRIKDEDERKAILNWDSGMGTIAMMRDGMMLKVTVALEKENCRYELTRKNGEVISRTIREGGLEILADEFGWVTFEGNVCLQIFETFGIMPFVNNRETGDYAIIDYIITDRVANKFVDAYEGETYPAFKKYSVDLKSKIESSQRILDGITFYDIQKYEDVLFKLKKYQRNLAHLKIHVPTKLPITKAFRYIDIQPLRLTKLPIYRVAPAIPTLNSLKSYITDFYNAAQGVCPTCGTKLIEMEVHSH